MSILRTIFGLRWTLALLSVEWPGKKPWAEPWTISFSTMLMRIHRWAALSFGSGAQIGRSLPSRLGMVKR
jgi:hypothetical protein